MGMASGLEKYLAILGLGPWCSPEQYARIRTDFLPWQRPLRDEGLGLREILWFSLHSTPSRYPHFTAEETEIQREPVTYLEEEDFEPGLPDFKAPVPGF